MHVAELLTREPELARAAGQLRARPETPFPILSLKVKLTWRCNLRCQLCRVWRAADAGPPVELDPALVIGLMDELTPRGLRKLHLSGGEVLLYPQLPELLRAARAHGLQVNLTTNGTRLDKDTARALVDARVHAVTVSIDAADAALHDELRGRPGAWREAWQGIRILASRRQRKGRGPLLGVNTLLTRRGLSGLGALHEQLLAAGVDRWRLLPPDTPQKKTRPTAEQWRALATTWDQWRPLLVRPPIGWRDAASAAEAAKGRYAGGFYHGHACYAPWFNLFVDADGRAFPCCMGKGVMRPLGRLGRDAAAHILDAPERRALQCSMASGHMHEICHTCDDFLEENQAFAALGEAP